MSSTNGAGGSSGYTKVPNVVDLLDSDTDDEHTAPPASVFADQDIVERHAAHAPLKSKKHMLLAKKQQYLMPFATMKPEEIFDKEMLDDGSLVNKCFASLRQSCGKDGKVKAKWNATFVADNIVRLFLLLQQNDKIKAGRRTSGRTSVKEHKGVKALKNLVDEMMQHAETDASVKSTKQKRSVFSVQRGERIQERVNFDQTKADFEACPRCNHFVCMPVDDAEAIDERNAAIRKDYKDRVAQWEGILPDPSKRGKKPMQKTTVCQRIGCYCFSMNCLCRQSGEGCVMCETRKQLGEAFLSQDHSGALRCLCNVCSCSCSALFPRNKRQAAALEAQEEAAKKQVCGEYQWR